MPDNHSSLRLVKMKWSNGDDKWHMLDAATDKLIQEFYDCCNINTTFVGIDKSRIDIWEVLIRRF